MIQVRRYTCGPVLVTTTYWGRTSRAGLVPTWQHAIDVTIVWSPDADALTTSVMVESSEPTDGALDSHHRAAASGLLTAWLGAPSASLPRAEREICALLHTPKSGAWSHDEDKQLTLIPREAIA